ncbi:MAG TPA: hypothetical protein VLQ91_01750 [Draconibacterium sp.]|nr:hypothetical protein [Draconibacterium sp.]
MKVKVLIIYFSTVLMNINQCNNSGQDLCKSLQFGEENVKTLLNDFLGKIDKDKDQESQFKQIEAFLLKQNCIEKVEFAKEYLRTSPPIKQVYLTMATDSKIKNVTINISLNNKELSVEKIIVNRSL